MPLPWLRVNIINKVKHAEITHSDWLKIVIWPPTSNHNALFQCSSLFILCEQSFGRNYAWELPCVSLWIFLDCWKLVRGQDRFAEAPEGGQQHQIGCWRQEEATKLQMLVALLSCFSALPSNVAIVALPSKVSMFALPSSVELPSNVFIVALQQLTIPSKLLMASTTAVMLPKLA